MALSASRASRLLPPVLPAWIRATCQINAGAVSWPPNARPASGGSGGGSSRAGDAKQRAAQYAREKERAQRAGQQAGTPSSASSESSGPRSRLAEAAAEWSEGQQALFLSSSSGLGMGAEAAIAQAIQDGAFDNLKGKGQPLPAEDHSAQFGRVDPLVAAVTRTMGAQGVKPLSLELRDEVRRELAALRLQLDLELRAALETSGSTANPASSESSESSSDSSSSSSNSSSGGSRGWFGGWFGGRGSESTAPAAAGRRHSVTSIRAGQHPALQHAAEELRRLIQQYNNACLADKEAFGAFWPLDRMKQLDWQAEVETALDRISSSSGSSSSGGSKQP